MCPMCAHEWSAAAAEGSADGVDRVVRDAVGNSLADGDTVTIVKGLKVSGPVGHDPGRHEGQGIRLLEEPVNGHDLDTTVPGFGRMQLKWSVVKKS